MDSLDDTDRSREKQLDIVVDYDAEDGDDTVINDNSSDTSANQSDDEPLLGKDDVDTIIKPKFQYHIEPVILAFSAFVFPLMKLAPQYVIELVGEEMSTNGTIVGHNFSACSNVSHDDPNYILSQQVSAAASIFQMYITVGITVLSIFTNLFLGAYSDRRGRKYSLIVPLIGTLGCNLVYTLVMWLHLPKEVLYAAGLFEGLGGGSITFLSGAMSYISDISDKESRGKRIVIAELSLFVPSALVNMGIGAWVDISGFLMPFAILTSMNLVILIYTWLVVPETIKVASRSTACYNCVDLKKSVALFIEDDGQGRRWKLQILVLAVMFPMVVAGSTVSTFFEKNEPLCWDAFLIAVNSALKVGVSVCGSFLGLRLFGFFDLSDQVIIIISGLGEVLGYLYIAFVTSTAMMLLGNLFFIFKYLFTPLLRTIMSKHVEPEENGAVFAGIAVLESCGRVVGQSTIQLIYAETVYFMHGFVFLVMGLFCLMGVIMVIVYMILLRLEDRRRLNSIA